ncbi:MAG: hypothetical protein WC015_08080, partial [Methanoregula sp.]
EHAGSDIIQERSVVTRIVFPGTFGEQVKREPRMNRFIVMEEFEIQERESKDEGKNTNEKKNSFKSKKMLYFC